MWWDTIKKRRVATGPWCDQTEIPRVIKNLLYKEQWGFFNPRVVQDQLEAVNRSFHSQCHRKHACAFWQQKYRCFWQKQGSKWHEKKKYKKNQSTSTKMLHIWLSESKFHWQTQALQNSNRITTVSELPTVSGCERLKTCRLEGGHNQKYSWQQITQWWTWRDLKACHFSLGSRLKNAYLFISIYWIFGPLLMFSGHSLTAHLRAVSEWESVIICRRLIEVALAILGG